MNISLQPTYRQRASKLFLSVLLALALLVAISSPAAAAGTTYYVDADASGTTPDGLSWANAFTNLQDALAAAVSGDEIWVAEGVYYPDNNDQSVSFNLQEGVALYGGFDPDSGVIAFADRDWSQFLTILSGDIDGNDINTDGNNIAESSTDIVGGNSNHVIFMNGTSSVTIIDGVVITAGQANGGFDDDSGAGLICNRGSNCSPTLTNITFSGNSANNFGGAIFNLAGSPTLTNVIFSGNWARNDAGAFYIGGGSPTMTNVLFSGNLAGQTGDVIGEGGALYLRSGAGVAIQPTLINVTFGGNRAGYRGGAIYSNGHRAVLTMTNVIMWGNSSPAGSGPNIYINQGQDQVIIRNSIVEGGTASFDGNIFPGTVNYNSAPYSELDPQFVQPVNAANAPTSSGDLRLQASSPAIDNGDNSAMPAGVITDLDGNDRIVNGTVDIGAYEFQNALNILSEFNQPDGPIGSNWNGDTGAFGISGNKLVATSGGANTDIYWNDAFGPNQYVFVTFDTVPQSGYLQLLLKAQTSGNWFDGVLDVLYDSNSNVVQVWTYEWQHSLGGPGWVQHGADIPVTLNDGDTFGAHALANGMVEVYVNSALVGTRDVSSWSYHNQGGYPGLWMEDAFGVTLDDFGGGNLP